MNSNSSENKYQAWRKPTPCNPEETCSSQGSGRMERGKGGESSLVRWVNRVTDTDASCNIYDKVISYSLPVVWFACIVSIITYTVIVAREVLLQLYK